jgi:hypothetical protein
LNLLEIKLLTDQITQAILDLHVPWHRRLAAIGWIDVDVMSLAVTLKFATGPG